MVVRGAEYDRQDRDFYRTPPEPIHALIGQRQFSSRVCDPCCGNGSVLRALRQKGFEAYGCDIHPIGVPEAKTCDFIRDPFPWQGQKLDFITNPPYGDKRASLAIAFVKQCLELTHPYRGRVAMLLPVDFDSGKTRVGIFRDHPAFDHKIALLTRISWFDEKPVCRECGGQGTKDFGATCQKCRGTGEGSYNPSANHAWFCWNWDRKSGDPTMSYAGW
jgi:hypothetical protein